MTRRTVRLLQIDCLSFLCSIRSVNLQRGVIARPVLLSLLVSAAFLCSCSANFLSSGKSSVSPEPTAYCSLLHVTPGPSETIQPKPFLGITFAPAKPDADISACRDGNAIRVVTVIDGTSAQKARLREGDLILSINSSPLCLEEKAVSGFFRKIIAQQEIGSTAELVILRDKEKINLAVPLLRMPSCSRAEAEHMAEGCPEAPLSILETELLNQGVLPLFHKVLSGLYERSNYAQNLTKGNEKACDPFQLKEFTYMYRNPQSAGAVAGELSDRVISETGREIYGLDKIMRTAAGLLDIEIDGEIDGESERESEKPLKDEEITFSGLLRTITRAGEKTEHAFSRLLPEEKELLRETALTQWDDDRWNTLLELSMKVELKELFDALLPVVSFLSGERLSMLKNDLLKRFPDNKAPILFEAMTPAGKVIVGGIGPNVYQEDAALILDLGGDDLYLNNAGGTRAGMPVAVVVDWEGNDRYLSKENFSQGAGLLGGGFLIDLSGADIFDALDGGQGVGLFGAGILYHGNGPGTYRGRKFCQGTGQMGIGLLWNSGGDTVYSCAGQGQALGFFKGAGILIDESGNDNYQLGGLEPDFRDPSKSTVSMGQGFGRGLRQEEKKDGVSGGIGLLIEGSGNDTYTADYFAQGASYYYGTGILVDISGDDRYIAGRYAQGAGIHSSVGVLLDRAGNDFYYASFGVAQGLGHDYGVGFFEDDQGDDHYWGGTLVQGSSTAGSIGMFIDKGGKDRYMCRDKGQGYAEEADSMAIMMTTVPAGGLKNTLGGKVPVRFGTGPGTHGCMEIINE